MTTPSGSPPRALSSRRRHQRARQPARPPPRERPQRRSRPQRPHLRRSRPERRHEPPHRRGHHHRRPPRQAVSAIRRTPARASRLPPTSTAPAAAGMARPTCRRRTSAWWDRTSTDSTPMATASRARVRSAPPESTRPAGTSSVASWMQDAVQRPLGPAVVLVDDRAGRGATTQDGRKSPRLGGAGWVCQASSSSWPSCRPPPPPSPVPGPALPGWVRRLPLPLTPLIASLFCP